MNIDSMSTAELLALYNEKTGKNVKRFSDRKTALRRVHEIVDGGNAGLRAKSKRAKAKAKASKEASERRKGFNFPVADGGPKSIREGTNRTKLVEMLTEGATFEDCVKKAGFKDERNTYQAIRLLHTYCGFGLSEKDGVIKLLSK